MLLLWESLSISNLFLFQTLTQSLTERALRSPVAFLFQLNVPLEWAAYRCMRFMPVRWQCSKETANTPCIGRRVFRIQKFRIRKLVETVSFRWSNGAIQCRWIHFKVELYLGSFTFQLAGAYTLLLKQGASYFTVLQYWCPIGDAFRRPLIGELYWGQFY